MMPKAECEQIAAELGAILTTSGGRYFECNAEAPAGHVWKCSGVHEIITAADPPWVLPAQCWRALLKDMRLGVEPCQVVDCEWCQVAPQPQE